MKACFYDIIVASGNVVNFVRALGKYGVRFEMGDEWDVVDNIDPAKKVWYRTFKLYTTKRQVKLICNEVGKIK